jgi:hypothetical protein
MIKTKRETEPIYAVVRRDDFWPCGRCEHEEYCEDACLMLRTRTGRRPKRTPKTGPGRDELPFVNKNDGR